VCCYKGEVLLLCVRGNLLTDTNSSKKICDVDGTGLISEPEAKSKAISLLGRIQAGCLKSAGKGQLITAVLWFTARGFSVSCISDA
jgi:hypothetical protein